MSTGRFFPILTGLVTKTLQQRWASGWCREMERNALFSVRNGETSFAPLRNTASKYEQENVYCYRVAGVGSLLDGIRYFKIF